ncbi:MAG: flagellar motor switch protein FliN [Verrucomicrobia bacterium]|nr:flagellar motor switch protein FliN [Verrucomicrobiota bacterium]
MSATTEYPPNLDILLDVPVKLTVVLGSCQMSMKDILQLSVGSVVELDKVADAPVDLYANQKLVAQGEVVVVDDQFGIKLTKIVGA